MTSAIEHLPTALDKYSMGCVAHKLLLPCSTDPVAFAAPALEERSSAPHAAVVCFILIVNSFEVQRGCKVEDPNLKWSELELPFASWKHTLCKHFCLD